ncbi:MAG: DEAD/DEAH box helicase, partial [Aeoliella sp.]
MIDNFPSIRFTGQLRPSQAEVVDIARQQLASGERKIHVVAPPGSGKTVLGLYLWAECIRVPAVVLSPNSAIQAQWVDRLDLFDCAGSVPSLASTNPKSPKLFTSLTYQAVTLPHRGSRELDADAIDAWIEKLVEKGQAKDPDEAEVWIDDLKRHNRSYYEDRLSGYRKEVRDEIAMGGGAMKTLHASALATLERLKHSGVGLLILDECHHLLSHWGRVLADAQRYFDHPIIIGLTATPPDMRGKPKEDVQRYREFFGPVDYEVPVPAVVKDGFLAPYQDLVQLVRPTPQELAYIANADDQLFELVEQLCQPFAATSDGSETGAESVPPATHSDESEFISEPIRVSIVAQELGAAADLMEANAEETQSAPPETLTEDEAPSTTRESLTEWLSRVLAERQLAIGKVADWREFADRDPGLAWAGPRFLQAREIPLPPGVPRPPQDVLSMARDKRWVMSESNRLPLMVLIPVLSRYIRRRLRRSSDPDDQLLA